MSKQTQTAKNFGIERKHVVRFADGSEDMVTTDLAEARDIADAAVGRATVITYAGEVTDTARATVSDVAELAQLIHAAVAVSDKHGGTLSPYIAGCVLRLAFPDRSASVLVNAVNLASDARGRTLEGAPAVPPF